MSLKFNKNRLGNKMLYKNNQTENKKKRNLYLYGFVTTGIISGISMLVFFRPFYLDRFALSENMGIQIVSLICFGVFGNLSKWLYQCFKRLNTGIKGEVKTQEILSSLPAQYHVLSNILIEYDGKKSEIDNLVVSPKGLVIVETKSYKGILEGKEEDSEWKYTKISSKGNQYTSSVKNPIKQANRQTYILSNLLKENGIHCWIDSYILILDGKCYVCSEKVFSDKTQFIQTILSLGRDKTLKESEINKIKEILTK